MDMRFLYAAIAVMLIVFAREFLRRKFNIDMDNININNLKSVFKDNTKDAVVKSTGNKSLVLVDCGSNKATVMATLRQITGLDYGWQFFKRSARRSFDAGASVYKAV